MGDIAVIIAFNLYGDRQKQKFNTFVFSRIDFDLIGGHFPARAAVNNIHLLNPQAYQIAGAVYGGIAAADNGGMVFCIHSDRI